MARKAKKPIQRKSEKLTVMLTPDVMKALNELADVTHYTKTTIVELGLCWMMRLYILNYSAAETDNIFQNINKSNIAEVAKLFLQWCKSCEDDPSLKINSHFNKMFWEVP